ncbi:hypothetical protein Tco_0181191, partial [Tanacetum coccineum]
MPPPFVLTAAVATTIVAGAMSALVYESDLDSETLHYVYVPRWNMINESALNDPDIEHEIRGRKRFEGKCVIQDGWLKERDAEIASLKAQLSLKEAEAAEVIHLRGQVVIVEATEAAQASELNGLKEQNAVLEGQVVALESAVVSKDAELASSNAQVAKATQDLSNLHLSCDELS